MTYDEIIAQMPEILTTEPEYMPNWENVPVDNSALADFFEGIFASLEHIAEVVHNFLSAIFAFPYIGVPIFVVLFLSLVLLCGNFLIDFSEKGFGGSRLNTNFQLSKYPNPDKTFYTNIYSWAVDLFFRRRDRKKYEDDLAEEAYNRIVEEQDALESQHIQEMKRVSEYTQLANVAADFFEKNPERYSININGHHFLSRDFDKTDFTLEQQRHIARARLQAEQEIQAEKNKAEGSPSYDMDRIMENLL